jgi:hypothetical protein
MALFTGTRLSSSHPLADYAALIAHARRQERIAAAAERFPPRIVVSQRDGTEAIVNNRGALLRRAARAADRGIAFRAMCLVFVSLCCLAPAAGAVGTRSFSAGSFSTGEKPQSKTWFHDGAWWCIVDGPDGVAIYEKVGDSLVRGAFANAVLQGSGFADVRWNGTHLFVLVHAGSNTFYKFTYSAGSRAYVLVSGFPVSAPSPSGSETSVMDVDSSGRVWLTAEGGGAVNVYYTTSADQRTWSSSPIVLQTGVGTDDISTVIAFGGNKIGVFWSDQNRDHFGFRVHNDADAPSTWSGLEAVWPGSGHADDHINVAADGTGRVYAVTKDDSDEFAVHRRSTSGAWTTKTNIAGGSGTRPIIQIAESDSRVYVLYTRWGVSPERIESRYADIGSLTFGNQTTFISDTGDMNNVSGTKQILPPGSLFAICENGSYCYFNGFGSPPSGNQPPNPPANLTALLQSSSVSLGWSAPASGPAPDGYNIYRSVDGGAFVQRNASLVASTNYIDAGLVTGQLCYQVRSSKNGIESTASNSACVDNLPAPVPPGAPNNLTANLVVPGSVAAVLQLPFDEGSGQTANDQSSNNLHARLGSATGTDTADPAWTSGQSGGALQFDGSNDFCEVADSPALDPAGSFTVEAWVRWEGGTRTIVDKGGSGERTHRVQVHSSGRIDFLWETSGSADQEISSPVVFTNSAWHHVACVYDQAAGENRVYFDGQAIASAGAGGTPAANAKSLLIGSRLGSGTSKKEYWKGAIDFVRITHSALYTGTFVPPVSPATAPADPFVAVGNSGDAPAAESVQLAWQPPTSGGAAVGYNVYRSVGGGAYAQLNAALVTVTSYTDANPASGDNCYQVTAVNAASQEGTPSNAACVALGPPPPSAPGAPQNLTAQLQGDPQETALAWDAPASGGTAAGYNVYRSVNGAAYAKINASLVNDTAYVDTGLPSGNLCYKVSGVDALSQEGTQSATACVEVIAPPPPAPGAPQNATATLRVIPGGSAGGVAAYPFDEGSGDITADATGLGHTGMLGSGPAIDSTDPAWTTGTSGQALSFDGTNDRVTVADAADLKFAGSFTLEAWVQRAVTGKAQCILSKGDSQRRNFWMLIDSSNRIDFRWETSGGSNKGATSSAIMTDTAWHHVACVWDAALGQNRIYVDGVLVQNKAEAGTPVTNSDPLHIGARLSSGSLKDYFQGKVDLARVSGGAIYTGNFTPPASFGTGSGTTVVDVDWEAPASGTPAGYFVERQVDGGAFTRLTATAITALAYTDTAPIAGALCYRVIAVDAVPQEGSPSNSACQLLVTKARPAAEPAPLVVERTLSAAPNPFNPTTQIAFRLVAAGDVSLVIYDARGARVKTLAQGRYEAGAHVVRWNGRTQAGHAAASGIYFAELRAGTVRARQRLVLLK